MLYLNSNANLRYDNDVGTSLVVATSNFSAHSIAPQSLSSTVLEKRPR